MTLVDGRVSDSVPVTDRGLTYGDSLFETIRFIDDRAPLWRLHMQRLEQGCRRLGFPPPDHQQLLNEALAAGGGSPERVVRIMLTRGDGDPGYPPPPSAVPRRIVSSAARRSGSCDPVRAIVCQTRLSVGGPLAGLKHGSRLEQVLAAAEVQQGGAAEGVVLDARDRIVEGIHGNLFLLDADGSCSTPALDHCGVAGVYRSWLLERAEIAVRELTLDDLRSAAGLFFANAVRGIMPVREVSGVGHHDVALVRQFEQATGRPW